MDYLISAFSENRKWAKTLGIIFILFFIIELISFFMSITGQSVLINIVDLLAGAAIYLLPGIILIKYAKSVAEAEEANNPVADLEEACIKQGQFFKVTVIVIIAGILLAAAAGFFAAATVSF